MSAFFSNFTTCRHGDTSIAFAGTRLESRSTAGINARLPIAISPRNISRPFENGVFHTSQLPHTHLRRASTVPRIRMTLIDESLAHGKLVTTPSEILAYDLVQGAHVRWSYIMDRSVPEPPTAVLLHGILGGRKNWGTFARRLAQEFPKWQFLLVDLRCHGDSASLKKRGPHTVASAALDVLKLVRPLDH